MTSAELLPQSVSAVTDDALGADDVTAVAERIARGEISAVEAVDAAIARVESVNAVLNAVAATDVRRRAGSGGLRRSPQRDKGQHPRRRYAGDDGLAGRLVPARRRRRCVHPSVPRHRRHPGLLDDDARVRLDREHRTRRRRRDPQPLAHGVQQRWFVRRLGRPRRVRRAPDRALQRWRRVDPHPRGRLRARRAQAVARSAAPRRGQCDDAGHGCGRPRAVMPSPFVHFVATLRSSTHVFSMAIHRPLNCVYAVSDGYVGP